MCVFCQCEVTRVCHAHYTRVCIHTTVCQGEVTRYVSTTVGVWLHGCTCACSVAYKLVVLHKLVLHTIVHTIVLHTLVLHKLVLHTIVHTIVLHTLVLHKIVMHKIVHTIVHTIVLHTSLVGGRDKLVRGRVLRTSWLEVECCVGGRVLRTSWLKVECCVGGRVLRTSWLEVECCIQAG